MADSLDLQPRFLLRHAASQLRDRAVETHGSPGAAFVARLDSDGDGALSTEEAAAAPRLPEGGGGAFARIDSDGNGLLSVAELDSRHAEVLEARASAAENYAAALRTELEG